MAKRKSRPQTCFKNRAVKAVAGMHNLEVVGSNPTPAINFVDKIYCDARLGFQPDGPQ